MVFAQATSQPERGNALARSSHFRQKLPKTDVLHPPQEFPFTLVNGHIIHFSRRGRALLRHPEDALKEYHACCMATLRIISEGYLLARTAGLKIDFKESRVRRTRGPIPLYLQGHLRPKKEIALPSDLEHLELIERVLAQTIAKVTPHYVYGAYIGRIMQGITEHSDIAEKINRHPLEDLSLFGLIHIVQELIVMKRVLELDELRATI